MPSPSASAAATPSPGSTVSASRRTSRSRTKRGQHAADEPERPERADARVRGAGHARERVGRAGRVEQRRRRGASRTRAPAPWRSSSGRRTRRRRRSRRGTRRSPPSRRRATGRARSAPTGSSRCPARSSRSRARRRRARGCRAAGTRVEGTGREGKRSRGRNWDRPMRTPSPPRSPPRSRPRSPPPARGRGHEHADSGPPGRAAARAASTRARSTGSPGRATAAAVRAFQARAGIEVDGIAGLQTRTALGKLGRPLFGRRVLTRGKVGWDVSVLQFLLDRKGLLRLRDRRPLRRDDRATPCAPSSAARASPWTGSPAPPRCARSAGAARSRRRSRPRRRPAPAVVHVVAAGENLTGIAARYGLTLRRARARERARPGRAGS